MTAPIRWKELDSEASEELRQVMQHSHALSPSAAQVDAMTAAVLSQLAIGAKVSAAASLTQASSKSLLPALHAKLTTLGLLVAVGGATGGVWYAMRPPPSAPATSVSAQAKPAREEVPPPEALQPTTATSQEEPRTTEDEPELKQAKARRSSATPSQGRQRVRPERQQKRGEVATDLDLLHSARLAHKHAPAYALKLLAAHERLFPDSPFREEREALWIEILQRSDPEAAAKRLTAFDLRYPNSVYRPRFIDAQPARQDADTP